MRRSDRPPLQTGKKALAKSVAGVALVLPLAYAVNAFFGGVSLTALTGTLLILSLITRPLRDRR